jgi:SAM-dependent methyltransferase
MFRFAFWRPRTARNVFGGLKDSRWLKVLKRSINEPRIDGVHLPGFPPPDMQSSTVGGTYERTLDEVFPFYRHVKDSCARNGTPLRRNSEILDFGVSWGRIVRFFMKDVDTTRLHGVDTSAEFLGAARDTGVPGHLHQIEPLGRLAYPDGFFDLVYAYSVFTHLPENVADHWLAEIARTLKPGALLIATVEPPRFLDFFASVNPADETLHPWHAAMARKIRADSDLKARLQAAGFVFMPQGDGVHDAVYGDSVMTPAYFREHWGQFLEPIEFLDNAQRFWQAVVIARKR